MKTYSTSKLLALFVIVSLLLLPYAFAGKPEKPAEEPIWSVYIPENIIIDVDGNTVPNGIQGIPGTVNEDGFYVFSGSDDATRNFANYINNSYSYFNFEILPAGIGKLPVKLDIAVETEWKDLCVGELDSCGGMLDQLKMEQPNGESISTLYEFSSQRIFFGFGSASGYNYETQKILDPDTYNPEIDEGEFVRLGGYFYIDSSFWGTQEDPQPFDYTIKGDFVGECLWVVRVNPNTWRIFGTVPEIDAAHRDISSDLVEVCTGRGKNRSCSLVNLRKIMSEGQITFNKEIELYFVREPAQ